MTKEIVEIPLERIERNPDQPRQDFPAAAMNQLAASIARRGLLQPILVRPVGLDRYMIVAGERRYRAHRQLGLATIKAIVEPIDEREMRLRAIVENLQRHDMNPIEEAKAFQTLLDEGYSPQGIVDELGLGSVSIVRQRLDLLDLALDIQQLVASKQLAVNMAWGVALAPREHQSRLLRDIQTGRLRTSDQVKHAGIALRDAAAQLDAFAGLPRASARDVQALSRLEERIGAIADMVQAGFKAGECVAAQRVSPDRVSLMADKLMLIRKHVLQMEHDLRRVAMQTTIKLEARRETV